MTTPPVWNTMLSWRAVFIMLCLAATHTGCTHASPAIVPPTRSGPVATETPSPTTAPETTAREPFIVTLRYLETKGAQVLIASEDCVVTTAESPPMS